MKVAEIRRTLSDLEALYAAAGARGPAKDMAALAEAIAPADDEDVETFLSRLEAALAETTDPTARAEAHLIALINAGIDKDKFYQAFQQLEDDKSVKGKDLDTIGAAYAMAPEFGKLYKTRAEKIRGIKDTFHEKKNFEDRGKVIDQLLPWQ